MTAVRPYQWQFNIPFATKVEYEIAPIDFDVLYNSVKGMERQLENEGSYLRAKKLKKTIKQLKILLLKY